MPIWGAHPIHDSVVRSLVGGNFVSLEAGKEKSECGRDVGGPEVKPVVGGRAPSIVVIMVAIEPRKIKGKILMRMLTAAVAASSDSLVP